MDAASSLNSLRQGFSLAYKLILTMAAGAFFTAFIVACTRFWSVHAGLRDAEQLLQQGLVQDALQKAREHQEWGRCFPGRFRESGILQVRAQVRSRRPDEAAAIAERIRVEGDSFIQTGGFRTFFSDPLNWLHRKTLSMAGTIMPVFVPSVRPGEWAGYTVLLEELAAIQDGPALERLAEDLAVRHPRSSITVAANATRAEVMGPSQSPARQTERKPRMVSATNGPSAKPFAFQARTPESADPGQPQPPPSWGIVTNTHCLALDPGSGQPVRELKPGDVLVIERTVTVRNTPALMGTLILNNRNVPDLAFRAEDLEIRQGDFSAVKPEEVALRSRLAEIAVEEMDLQAKVNREEASLSPAELACRQAQGKLDAFTREVALLQAKMDRSTGSDRMATIDKLRQMKYQEQTLLRDVQKKKEAAGLTSRTGESPLAARLGALRQEKQALLKRLQSQAS